MLGSIDGVEQVFNKSGATNLLFVQIQGVYASTRNQVKEQFTIITAHGNGFIILFLKKNRTT